MSKTKKSTPKTVEVLKHVDASRTNIPTAEYESVMHDVDRDPIKVVYERRNPGVDPQLIWRGKDVTDWSELVAPAPPLFIQEKVHPKALVDDLMQHSANKTAGDFEQIDLFADFNGLDDDVAQTEFYGHEANWTNRMILGDSLQVMASLAEREGLREQVQCIYFDPPYGIKFNSNFQWSTTTSDVKDGSASHITREPEQVKAFRDTWRDGIHSYLTYLRDRLTVARDMLAKSGSIFVQIGDENVHRVRVLLDEIFGCSNFVVQLAIQKTGSQTGTFVQSNVDTILWYAKSRDSCKFRPLLVDRELSGPGGTGYTEVTLPDGRDVPLSSYDDVTAGKPLPKDRIWTSYPLTSEGFRDTTTVEFTFQGRTFHPGKSRHWGVLVSGLERVGRAGRLVAEASQVRLKRYFGDSPSIPLGAYWTDIGGVSGKVYVVQTTVRAVQRCILMTTDPGDLVLDPTCGSGTTATVAEQWGRRWITMDTSRVALALARARVMGARYPYYLLEDSPQGRKKRAALSRREQKTGPTTGNLRYGFVYRQVPRITLKSIADNQEIDVISDRWKDRLDTLRASLNAATVQAWEEWEIPAEVDAEWTDDAKRLHREWREALVARQREFEASMMASADFQPLYDQPFEDSKVARVAGPFTVESLSPHRTVNFDENDRLIEPPGDDGRDGVYQDFASMVLENLQTAGVQQAHKEDKLDFLSVSPWPGKLICGEGTYREGEDESAPEKRAGIFVGPEFGTVARADLVAAAKEAGDVGFDVLVSCAFNYEAHASEFDQLGRIPVLKARMNADLHMSEELKNTGKGNLFVIFGEPDIEVLDADDGGATSGQVRVRVNGVDVFDPSTGEIRSDNADGIACWFVDTDYDEESFFVRQAYFLGANDPYKALKTTLKAEIDQEAWESLHSDTSRPFNKPESGRIAVKVINRLGDEVMKVMRVG
jgi:adenine-specific DNA-methyltransferase